MMYSCALWKPTSELKPGEEESLADAQIRKVHNIIDKARIKKEHHVLDIGGGWAFLAIEAVKKTGCRVTVTTLSVEQKALGEQRVKDAGLEDRIEVRDFSYSGENPDSSMGLLESGGHLDRDGMLTWT